MYRDDPLDDEAELRAIVGDDPVDELVTAADEVTAADSGTDVDRTPVEVALDVLRVLQGWADDDAAGRWFLREQRRLDGRSAVAALADGDYDEVEDAATAWVAAQG